MEQFITGAIAMAYAAAGLFFLRFWRDTRDRLFVIFAAAFWLLGLVRLALALVGYVSEGATYLFWVRLLAYLLLLFAIVDKNRARHPKH
jgi:hypothetical protein